MNLYKKFIDGLVMNHYNKLIKDNREVMFSPSYKMSGVRAAVNIIIFSLIAYVVVMPSNVGIFFIWLLLCAYVYKGAVESKMGDGYPYLEVGSALGLMIMYLIMIPVSMLVHFTFFTGYEYLADLADLSQLDGFFARLFVLFVTWISYMLLFRDSVWDERNKEQIKEFATQDEKMEEDAGEARRKNGTYKDFIKKLDKKFTLPKDIKTTEQIKDPVVSKKRLDEFVEWVYGISKNDKRPNLIDLLNKSKKLEVSIPELLISITQINKDSWSTIELLDGELSTYMICSGTGHFHREFDNKKWVAIINNPNVTYEACDEIYEDESWAEYDSSEEELYLEEEGFYIPYDLCKGAYDYDGGYSDGGSNLYCAQMTIFYKEDVIINEGKFRFKEGEEKHLVTLLMASYKPSLLKRVLNELESRE